jgi:DNA-binding transcriptional ArsR family regulator
MHRRASDHVPVVPSSDPDPDRAERRGLAVLNLPGRRPSPDRGERALSEEVADVMFALSAPSRVQILLCLLDGAHGVSELVERLELEQSAMSHQLRVLRDHSLVRVERQGRRRLYRLYDDHVVQLVTEAVRHVEQRTGGRPRAAASIDGEARALAAD